MLQLAALLSLYFASTTVDAHAYLDPGTGSIILQGVIATVATGLFVMKSYLYRLKHLLGLNRVKGGDTEG